MPSAKSEDLYPYLKFPLKEDNHPPRTTKNRLLPDQKYLYHDTRQDTYVKTKENLSKLWLQKSINEDDAFSIIIDS